MTTEEQINLLHKEIDALRTRLQKQDDAIRGAAFVVSEHHKILRQFFKEFHDGSKYSMCMGIIDTQLVEGP